MNDISKDVVVEMGKMEVASSPDRLVTSGIGSCIVITLYDPVRKRGALAHTMLPRIEESRMNTNPFKFTDYAVEEMVRRMRASGSRVGDLEAKIVGGADMFPSIGHSSMSVGEENVLAAKERLRKEGVGLAGEVVGGSVGRSVVFDTASGIVTVRMKI